MLKLANASALLPVPTGYLQISPLPSPFCLYLSLVIPTYEEGENIQSLIEQLRQLLDSVIRDRYEIIVVDDNSPDLTWEIALNLSRLYPQVKAICRQEERGLSTAVIRGWQNARGEVLGVIDADFQHPPEIILKLLEKMEGGADLTVASRHLPGGGMENWSAIRQFLSRGARFLGSLFLPEAIARVSDPLSGCFLVRREAIAGKVLDPIGYKILLEVLCRGRLSQVNEVGYIFRQRSRGKSKVNCQQYIDYVRHLWRLWRACSLVRQRK